MHQRHAQRHPGEPARYRRRIARRSAAPPRSRASRHRRASSTPRYRRDVDVADDHGVATRVGAACHREAAVEVVAPPGTAQPPRATARDANATASGDPTKKVAFGRVAVGQVDDGLRPPQHVGHSPVSILAKTHAERTAPPSSVGSPIDSIRALLRRPAATPRALGPDRCARSPARSCRWPATPCPRRRCTTPATPRNRCRQCRMDPPSGAAQHGARGDAHRCAVRVIGGQCVGDPAGALPTQPRCGDVAVGRPRAGAHVPAKRGVQITGGLQMLGDQRRVLVGRCRVTLLRSRRPAAGAARRDRI